LNRITTNKTSKESKSILNLDIRPLSYASLLEAFQVLREALPSDRRWLIDLLASLNPWKGIGLPWLGGCEYLRYWVSIEKNRVVGVTGMYIPRQTPESISWLGWTAVRPEIHRRGIGKFMLDYIFQQAKSMEIATLAVYTSIKHPKAIAFYQKLGFFPGKGKGNYLVYKKTLL